MRRASPTLVSLSAQVNILTMKTSVAAHPEGKVSIEAHDCRDGFCKVCIDLKDGSGPVEAIVPIDQLYFAIRATREAMGHVPIPRQSEVRAKTEPDDADTDAPPSTLRSIYSR